MQKILLLVMSLLCFGSVEAQIYGDVNGDGYVTSADVTALYNFMLSNDMTGIVNGDLNNDGFITSADVTAVYDVMLGNVQPNPPQYIDYTVNGVTFRMIYVKGGTFMMGNEAVESESPVHSVTVTDFYMGETECTQALWKALFPDFAYFEKVGDDKPCNGQLYSETLQFITALNDYLHESCQLPADKNFMLPTEAQWEWAARGGIKSQGYTYAGSNDFNEVAWCAQNSNYDLHDVKLKAPNELGLYDMSGNAYEATTDNFSDDYSWATDGEVDPTGSPTPSSRGITRRGGGYAHDAYRSTVTKRDFYDTDTGGSEDQSFRLILK